MVFDRNRYHPSGYSGVIYLSAFGQIMLEKSVDILFRNNTGRYTIAFIPLTNHYMHTNFNSHNDVMILKLILCREGASIVVVGQSLSADLTEQLYNPQCFLQYAIPTAPPPTWKVIIHMS